MAVPTLDATVGGASANTYLLEAAADTYHDERLYNSRWVEADQDYKLRSLVWATRLLDTFHWKGNPTAAGTQRLEFPRTGILSWDDVDVASDAIPDGILWATAELSFQLIKNAELTEGTADDLRSVSIGPVTLGMNASVLRGVAPAIRGGGDGLAMLPTLVRRYITPFIMSSHNARLVRA
jgi:hypothetical protein